MNGDQVKAIREALGVALGRRISQADLAHLLKLAPANGKDVVRSWEDGKKEVSGPAAVALQLLGYGAGVGAVPAVAIDRGVNAGGIGDDGMETFDKFSVGDVFRGVMLGIAESMLSFE